MRLIITTKRSEEYPDICDDVISFGMEEGKLIILFTDQTTMKYNMKDVISIEPSYDSIPLQFPSNMTVH